MSNGRPHGPFLAGDIGGTHARLVLFEDPAEAPGAVEVYPSREYPGLGEIAEAFLAAHPARPAAASFGVAGPVHDGRTEAVNLPWTVDARELGRRLGIERVVLINDLEANAWGLDALGPADLAPLNDATPEAGGAVALISPGTGLGQAFITYGPFGPAAHASEGGHADFSPRSDQESDLRRWLARDEEHVSYERVCSGPGLVNVYEFLRERSGGPLPAWLERGRAAGDMAAAITSAGLDRRDQVASDALDLMISIYGAQAGNLALTVLATGGVYLGGGIVPKVVDRLREGRFMEAFTAKGRMSRLLERIPVYAILSERAALIGAGRHAASELARVGAGFGSGNEGSPSSSPDRRM
jgi:glucokinase